MTKEPHKLQIHGCFFQTFYHWKLVTAHFKQIEKKFSASNSNFEMPKPLVEATTGATSAVIANFLVYPLDVIASRIQVSSEKDPSKREVLKLLLKKRGVLGLYNGIIVSLTQTFLSSFGYFWFYSLVKKLYYRINKKPGIAIELLLGAIAGGLSRVLTTPISVVTMRKQINDDVKKDSYLGIITEIFKDDGISGFWRGFKASLLLTLNPAITYGLYERFEKLKPTKLTPEEVFFLGILTKSLATVVTYPYILAKSILQGSNSTLTIHDCLAVEIQRNGIASLYRGLMVQLSKSASTQAILFVIKDYLEKLYAAMQHINKQQNHK